MAMCLKWSLQSGTDRPPGACSARPRIFVRCDLAEKVSVTTTNGRAVGTLCTKKYEPVKVFEDHSRGIVCYRDEYGEVICEGYDDEGSHFYPTTSQQQEQQYRDDMKLYSILPGIQPYLAEGVDYECINKEAVAISPEGIDGSRDLLQFLC